MNGLRLTLSNDEVYDLVVHVASGCMDDVAEIAAVLVKGVDERRR